MTELSLAGSRIRAGIWEGVLTGGAMTPKVEVLHLERPLEGVRVSDFSGHPGQWTIQMPIPVQALNDGVQTFVVYDTVTGTKLGHFTVLMGEVLENDIRTELDLLRAELDLLKRAFRRHCIETAS